MTGKPAINRSFSRPEGSTQSQITVALVGQPNVGKSTVFNLLTGLTQHVGNWPGKTVEFKAGTYHHKGLTMQIVDLPGNYSLTANSLEERIARDFIIKEQPDVVVVIANAAALERNLYLVAELLCLPAPLVLGLNMMDVAEQQGIQIETHVLEAALGLPKGGVGKSSVAGLLASSLRKRGLKVGVLDADITGPSIPKMFGVHQLPEGGPEGIFPIESRSGIKLMSINFLLPDEDQPVIWRGPLISRAIQQFWSDIAWGDLDVLIIDLPPGTSDASLTVMQSLPLDGVLLVTSPQDLAGMVVRKAANMATKIGARLIGLVENMSYIFCPECGAKIDLFGKSHAENTARWIGTRLLGHLPLDPQLSTLCDEGAIEAYHSPVFELITNQVVELTPPRELETLLHGSVNDKEWLQ